ncbi:MULTISPECIES: acyltransferase [unclassified Novosphingobium]|uniref:acyltransferase family protein n=1 Tax=unclassified Novosphingobium TaxID=2644732 RepID=UPI0025DFB840|nr:MULTISPECIES: acyltransferase [unclassified Novosphingobium]HQV04295.1 acyltransferase [Novosphingobium sp.]
MSGAGPRHLDALTGIRGIAAWGVVLYHIRLSLTAILPDPVIAAVAKGYLAVDLFFILSGFVIWYNYAARITQGGWAETRHFLWRRFARVWPLHGAILAAFVGFAALLIATGRDASGYPLAELPLHLLLVQNWGLTSDLSWNHPAWSISTEFAAYLLFPPLVLAARWDRMPSWVPAIVAAALAGAIHLLFALNGYTGLGDDIPGMGLWRCLAGFAMGCMLCQLWQRWQNVPRGGVYAGLAFVALAAGGLALGLPETVWVPATFFTGLLALALGKGPLVQLLGGKVLSYLGEISYSTYLAHFLLFILFKLVFVDASLQLGWGGLAGFLALVLAASIGLYHGLEKPAQRWLNARSPRWASRPAPSPAE